MASFLFTGRSQQIREHTEKMKNTWCHLSNQISLLAFTDIIMCGVHRRNGGRRLCLHWQRGAPFSVQSKTFTLIQLCYACVVYSSGQNAEMHMCIQVIANVPLFCTWLQKMFFILSHSVVAEIPDCLFLGCFHAIHISKAVCK